MNPINRHSTNQSQGPGSEENSEAEGQEPPFCVIQRLFPRIAKAIELMWGNPELDDYLHKLILDQRGDRVGFPAEVLGALLKLHNQHTARFKFQRPEDAWAQEDRINRGGKNGPARK
ncbi:MAG: hypothetical protein Q8Q16_04740 [Betaproteobacteria bacterium]|nr:hypothetical protein [Betaproteobacteria bacterium]OGA33264.1 MAG: hypothetical protein A3F75_10825 [Betaproteobacteria bacterium RIFCSPLOWO2_12_FULL_64_23]